MGATLYGMTKTTVYLSVELEARLNAEAAASGVSKAELIREGVAMRLNASTRPTRDRTLPVFNSGQALTAQEMDKAVYEHIKERTERR